MTESEGRDRNTEVVLRVNVARGVRAKLRIILWGHPVAQIRALLSIPKTTRAIGVPVVSQWSPPVSSFAPRRRHGIPAGYQWELNGTPVSRWCPVASLGCEGKE